MTKSYQGLYLRDLLGYSLKTNIYPIANTRNIGRKVVDLDNFYKDYPFYVDAIKNNTGEASFFTYATFDRFISNSSITKTVNGGLNLNLGLFSVSNKTNIKNVLTNFYLDSIHSVFGELNISIRDSIYRMQHSSEILKKIKTNYLSNDFKEELYNLHPSEFFNVHGGFVLSEFITRGKAIALYGATSKSTVSSEIIENNMDIEVKSSYGFSYNDKNSTISGDLKLGRNTTSSTSITNKFSSINMSIKTIGGNSSFASFAIPKEINDTDINLSQWLSSLNDKNTHSIIEIGEEGLIPISEFIIERNLKGQIEKYYNNENLIIEDLKEPYISISVLVCQPVQVFVLGTYMETRFGNKILLRSKFMGHMMQPDFDQIVEDYILSEAERVNKMFKIKVVNEVGYYSLNYNPESNTVFDFNAYKEEDLKKFIYKGSIYIINEKAINSANTSINNKKFALSIHNSSIIREYGMTEFIERLPIIDMNYDDLIRNYVIDAL